MSVSSIPFSSQAIEYSIDVLADYMESNKHIKYDRNMPRAQESWVVMKGRVKIYYYDLNNKEMNSYRTAYKRRLNGFFDELTKGFTPISEKLKISGPRSCNTKFSGWDRKI